MNVEKNGDLNTGLKSWHLKVLQISKERQSIGHERLQGLPGDPLEKASGLVVLHQVRLPHLRAAVENPSCAWF